MTQRMAAEKRYAFVARKLTEAIGSGVYPVGTILPTEVELAGLYGVSRATVRLALSNLHQLGLISRKRNVGTRVEASRPPQEYSSYAQSLGTVDDLLQYAKDTRRAVQARTRVVADEDLAIRLGCRPGRRWMQFSSLRLPENEGEEAPLCWTDAFVDDLYGDLVAENIDSYPGAISSLIEARTGKRIGEVVQSIQAVSISPALARSLRVGPASPGLEITRHYLDEGGQCLLVTFSTYPAHKFQYEMRLLRRA